MNLAAANALLKSLEEPTASTRILLVADEISALPATILSRCNRIRITANAVDGEKEVVGLLAMHHEDHLEVRPEEVRSALSLAGGSPRDAVSVITHDLLPWANKVAKWLSSPGTTAPPLPTTSGKSAASIESCGIVLHSMLHGSLLQQLNLEGPEKSEVSLSGWPIERLVAASKKLSDELMRLRRPGLDVKLRLHSILIELSRIESE